MAIKISWFSLDEGVYQIRAISRCGSREGCKNGNVPSAALGYAGAFAAELAIERNAWLVTADPEFSKVGKGLSVYSLPRHEK